MIGVDFCINSNDAIITEYNNHFYFMPHTLLRKYISNYTITCSSSLKQDINDEASEELTIIPDGSGCIIFEFDGKEIDEICWGPTSKLVKVKQGNSKYNKIMFFIEFLPGGLHALTGIHQKELKDVQCHVYDIDSKLSKSFRNAVESSRNIDELIFKVDSILIHAIEENRRNLKNILSFVDRIRHTGGVMQIKKLAESEYISERQLNRIFEEIIGLSPKMFSRLVRINKAIKTYKRYAMSNSTYIAYESGFFDQSHLIREFNEFCGTTPSNFIKNMSDFYNEPFKY